MGTLPYIISPFLNLHSGRTLTFPKTHVLVDASVSQVLEQPLFYLPLSERTPTGSSTTLFLSWLTTQYFSLTDTGATKCSDTHAFDVLALEVSLTLERFMDEPLNRIWPCLRFLLDKFCFPDEGVVAGVY